jgi:glycosyltransferase involved in cell wall biosynthesis
MVGGIPELIEDGVTGFAAPPRNPEALATAVERCLTAADRSDIVNRARRRAEDFSIEKTIAGMEKVYRLVAGNR